MGRSSSITVEPENSRTVILEEKQNPEPLGTTEAKTHYEIVNIVKRTLHFRLNRAVEESPEDALSTPRIASPADCWACRVPGDRQGYPITAFETLKTRDEPAANRKQEWAGSKDVSLKRIVIDNGGAVEKLKQRR
ncbi:UNVERIFIED_CONTAM: hypothetical protein FKN15_002540 [Acipenser sinensis]